MPQLPHQHLRCAIAQLNGDWSELSEHLADPDLPPWWREYRPPKPRDAAMPGEELVTRLPGRVQLWMQWAALMSPRVARRVLLATGVHNRRY